MRVLLDESLPRRLARFVTEGVVETVYDRGWAGLKNGALLKRAEEDFDVFLTADQNLRYEQNLTGFSIKVVVLAGRSNRLEDLKPLMPDAEAAFRDMEAGEIRSVGADR